MKPIQVEPGGGLPEGDIGEAEGPEEEAQDLVRGRARAGHGRADQGVVPAPHPQDLRPRLRHVRLLPALEVLLVLRLKSGQPQGIQSHR